VTDKDGGVEDRKAGELVRHHSTCPWKRIPETPPRVVKVRDNRKSLYVFVEETI
jgi:hypothetical protein